MRTKQKIMKITFSLLAVVLVTTAFLSNIVFAEVFESEQGLSFTLNPTVNVSISGSSDGLLIDNLTPGDYKDSNIITVSASSNATAGYSLYANVGNSTHSSPSFNTTNLTHSNGTNVLASLATTDSISSMSSADTSSNGRWGYSYSTNSGSTWSNYSGLPIYSAGNGKVLVDVNNNSGTSSIQFKIGAKAKATQVSGAYTNIINFIGVGKVITTKYAITFYANAGSDTVTNMPANIALSDNKTTTDGSVQIASNVPVRDGYIFKGWCTVSTSDDTCSGDTIQPSGFLALNTTAATASKELYAMWKSNSAAPGLCTDTATCMQTMTSCPATATTVTDARDGKTYRVQQLTGGGCWMLDNLSLDPTTVSLADLKGNTNASDTTLEYLKNGGGTTSDQYPTAAVGYGDSSDYYSVPKVSVSGTCLNAYCVDSPSSGQWNSEVVTPATINGVTSIAQGKIGVYYNYCAASAGSYCWGDGTASTGSPSSDPDTSTIRDVTEDLCPAGWHMPTSDTKNGGEYNALYTVYNSDYTAFQTALVTPLSGYFYSGAARSQGGDGYFWSSTWSSSYGMRGLTVYPSDVKPSDYNGRSRGQSLRCSLGS